MNEKEQELLARVLDLFAAKFDNRALLRGGMVLKVMGSARYTNDLDYVFVPYGSKKEVQADIINSLKAIENSTVKYSLNSQCLRILLNVGDASIQIEVKVAQKIKSAVISTMLFSPKFNLPKRLIHIVDHSISLANKLAAWNERRLARDLYDIWFFLQMNIEADIETLEMRLKKPSYSTTLKKEDYFTGKGLAEFYDFIRSTVAQLSDREIEDQLSDYLLPDELTGLVPLIRSSLVKLRVR